MMMMLMIMMMMMMMITMMIMMMMIMMIMIIIITRIRIWSWEWQPITGQWAMWHVRAIPSLSLQLASDLLRKRLDRGVSRRMPVDHCKQLETRSHQILRIPPNVFHCALECQSVASWQREHSSSKSGAIFRLSGFPFGGSDFVCRDATQRWQSHCATLLAQDTKSRIMRTLQPTHRTRQDVLNMWPVRQSLALGMLGPTWAKRPLATGIVPTVRAVHRTATSCCVDLTVIATNLDAGEAGWSRITPLWKHNP